MNDPKDIVVDIKQGEKAISRNSIRKESASKRKSIINTEARFNNLVLGLKRNLSKKLYKKTIKEIDNLIENKYICEKNCEFWKLITLKMRAILKIIKNKITKYLIYYYEKAKLKYHIFKIKKYFNLIRTEFNTFFEYNQETKVINNIEMVNELILCYIEYIYLISFYHKKTGNIIESISYLSLILNLYKETKLFLRSSQAIYKIGKCFILLAQICINNEDYYSCIEYLNTAMDISLKNIIFLSYDLNDGIFIGDKSILFDGDNINNKNKARDEINNNYVDKRMKKIIIDIVYIYFYRGICYENIGKINYGIKSYYQCLWFLRHFFPNNFQNFLNLIKNILNKSIEFKEAIDYLDKKIKDYDDFQLKMKKLGLKDRNKNKIKYSNLYSKKFEGLVYKLDNLKINEIDMTNKFDIKKNIKCANMVKREGKDKNIFLSDLRLLNAYLSDDFKVIIDNMSKIKSFDLEYSTKDRIQKLIRKIYFEQNQRKIKILQKGKKENENNIFSNLKKRASNNRYDSIYNNINSNLHNSFKKMRNNSAYFYLKEKDCKKNIFNFYNSKPWKDLSKTPSTNHKNKDIEINTSFKNEMIKNPFKKRESFKREKHIRINSACASKKIKIFEEDKELNKYFNNKYLAKRNYIKKLEDRELIFQKSLLKLKNTPKIAMPIYNKELIKRKANESFHNKMSLLDNSSINWKENISDEEFKKIKTYNKLQKSVLMSLDENAFAKYKEEEKRQKMEKNKKIAFNSLLNNLNNNNENIIDKLNVGLEELRQREIIESKKLKKLLKEKREIRKRKNEKIEQFYKDNFTYFINRNKNFSRNYFFLKKSYSSSYFY